MGAPIAHNLIADGFEVSVWDRSTDRAAALVDAGARLASSPAEAAEGAAVVLEMFTDGETVAAAMLGRQGAVASVPPGSAWIQMATVGQEWTERLAAVARTHQLEFVDAPVSGSDGPAREGKLIVLASGPRGSARCWSPYSTPSGRRRSGLGRPATGPG